MTCNFTLLLAILSSIFSAMPEPAQNPNFIETLPTSWIELQEIDDEFFNLIPCEEYYDPEDDEMSGFIISSKAELMLEEDMEDNQFFVAFSEGFRLWVVSSEKSKENESIIIKTVGKPIIFRWIVKGKLAQWNFQGLEYEGFYTPSEFIDEYQEFEEEC